MRYTVFAPAHTMYFIVKKISGMIFGGTVPFDQRRRRSRSTAGFSLVEVVIALGVVAFALIPLMGLVPMGLSTSRLAIDTTVEAQIIQYMTDQAQQSNFSALSELNSTIPTGFDAYGTVTTSSSPIYRAGFSVPSSPGGTTLPGGTVTYNLTPITIYILSTRTLGGMAATTQQALVANPACKQYTIFVANNGL